MLAAEVFAWGDEGLTDWPLKFHAIPTLKRATLSSFTALQKAQTQNKDMNQKGILDPLVIIYTPMTYSIKTKYTDLHIYVHGSTQCTI